jgi:CDP-paratose 2-epimerase
MHLLITGICGFVGSTLAEALLAHCAPGSLQLTGIDNLSRSGSWLNRERLAARGISIIHADIRQASDLDALGPFDWVIDCAANPSVLAGVDGKSSSRQVVEHNLGGTINLLESCKRWHAGFILLSTSRVYSIPPLAALDVAVHDSAYRPVFRVHRTEDSDQTSDNGYQEHPATFATPQSAIRTPQSAIRNPQSTIHNPRSSFPLPPGLSPLGITEQFSTAPPVSLYGSTKLASEALALEYGLTFDFPVWINRCGVMAGARQFGKPDQGIFAFWIHSWREGRALKYIGFDGLGHQVRDCLHPRDLAPLILKQVGSNTPCQPDNPHAASPSAPPSSISAFQRFSVSAFPNILNLSGGLASAMSLRQLSDWCVDRFPTSNTAATLPSGPSNSAPPAQRPFDLPWVVLDHSLASQTWDWHPQTPVASILEEIATFAEAHPNWIATSA